MYALVHRWRSESQQLRHRYGDERMAVLLEVVAAELQDALEVSESKLLTLTQAAQECGYTADHLSRLVRDKKIPNHGRKNAPRIARRDLPRKPQSLPSEPPAVQIDGAERRQIAQSIVNRHR